MSEKITQQCIWCESPDTFFMGEDGWFRYFHCGKCSADFPINMQKFAWTEDQIEQQVKSNEVNIIEDEK